MTMDQAIREHYPMPLDVRTCARAANWHLHFGWENPFDGYSFVESRAWLVDWLNGLAVVWWDEAREAIVTVRSERSEALERSLASGEDDGLEWIDDTEIDAGMIARAYGLGALYRHR